MKQDAIENLAKDVRTEIERLEKDFAVHWEEHLEWLDALARQLEAVSPQANKRKEWR